MAANPDTEVKTQNNLSGYIRNIYGIALEKGLIGEDSFQQVKSFPQSDKFKKEPTPLTPEEAKRLLDAAEPEIIRFIAIRLLADFAPQSEMNLIDVTSVSPARNLRST